MRRTPRPTDPTACMVRVAVLGIVAVAGFTGSGCMATATAKQDVTIVPTLPAYSGPKARLAIGKFDWAVGRQGGAVTIETPDGTYTWSATQQTEYLNGLGDMLTTALTESNRYQVLESLDLDPLKDEIGLGEQGFVKEASAVEKGGWEGADLIVLASITSWEPDAGGRSIGAGGFLPGVLGGARVGKKKAKMGMHIRLVDPRSRVTIVSKAVSAEASSWNMTGGGIGVVGGSLLGGVLSQYENTPMGEAISVCIAEAVKLVAENTPSQYFSHS